VFLELAGAWGGPLVVSQVVLSLRGVPLDNDYIVQVIYRAVVLYLECCLGPVLPIELLPSLSALLPYVFVLLAFLLGVRLIHQVEHTVLALALAREPGASILLWPGPPGPDTESSVGLLAIGPQEAVVTRAVIEDPRDRLR